jgi:hypothetical protein
MVASCGALVKACTGCSSGDSHASASATPQRDPQQGRAVRRFVHLGQQDVPQAAGVRVLITDTIAYESRRAAEACR